MKFGLENSTVSIINSVFESHIEIESVKIYGSRAKGDYRKASDIDLVYFSSEDITAKLLGELDELPTPYLFDVINYYEISNTDLKEHIDRIGQVFFTKK